MSSLNVYTLDELNRDEIEEVAGIYDQAYPETGIDAETLQSTANDPRQHFYTISVGSGEDERFVAAGRVDLNYQGMDTELSEAAVLPELQGKGLGKTLFNIRDQQAVASSQGRVQTWASTKNPGAQAVALENGYVPAGVELNGSTPRSDGTVQNVLMMNPETLYEENRTVYTTESTHDAIDSLLNGTELGETLSRNVEVVDEKYDGDIGYMVSSEEMGTTTVMLGVQGVNGGGEVSQGEMYRKVARGPVDEAMSNDPFNNNKQVIVDMTNPEAASLTDELVERGFQPTAMLPQAPRPNDLSKDNTRDDVLFELVDEVKEIDTVEDIGDWLEGTEIPAKPSQ